MHVSFGTPGLSHSNMGLGGPGWRRHHGADDAASVGGATSTHTATSTSTNTIGDALGSLSDSIAAMRSQLDSLATSFAFPDSSASVSAAQLINRQKGVMEIHTLEGDTVTLRFSARTAVNYSSAQANVDGTTVSSSALDVSSRSRVSLQVEGDLNDEELAAINALVGQVNDLTDTFFDGNVDEALSQAMSLTYDSSQLADYSLRLKLRQSFEGYSAALLPAASTTPAPTESTGTPAPTEAAPVASTPVASETPAPVVDAGAVEPAVGAGESAETPATTETPADTGTATGGTLTLAEFAAKVRMSFTMRDGDSRIGLSYDLKVKLLVTSIQQAAPQAVDDAVASALTQQLTDTTSAH